MNLGVSNITAAGLRGICPTVRPQPWTQTGTQTGTVDPLCCRAHMSYGCQIGECFLLMDLGRGRSTRVILIRSCAASTLRLKSSPLSLASPIMSGANSLWTTRRPSPSRSRMKISLFHVNTTLRVNHRHFLQCDMALLSSKSLRTFGWREE